ncbi:MAG: leucine--tRNA ligase [archaeon]
MDIAAIEKKWQEEWDNSHVFESEAGGGQKYYVLEMFPYPSASGLHMGHAFNYTIGDVYGRLKRMQGYNVLYPMGYDSLGLPAEIAAINKGINPKEYTDEAISNFIRQQKALGLSYDWRREVRTHNPDYYKWDQWIFLKMFEGGIAYRKNSAVNFCPLCNSVLANEQVHDGKCWRHKEKVEIRQLEQWFFKITDYADELYESINELKEWPADIKAMQKNWIGKSWGTEILFEINGKKWPIFTTRPDTVYGVTFMVVSAQHPKLMELVTKEHEGEVNEFLKKIKSTSEKDYEELEKEGAFTGSYAINPSTNEKIPIYAGNFVLADYGSGIVMAVPAHDQRDFEFAKKYGIRIKLVIQPKNQRIEAEKMEEAFSEEGFLVNSEMFNGMESANAKEAITTHLQKLGFGKKTIQYKLRDWLVSRQRYWGTPIPIIYCDKCGAVPVPDKDLPVILPDKVEFGKGNPLETNSSFVNVKCPKCNANAKRETDTMDTFVNSSWYFLRYCDAKNEKEIFGKDKAKYWMPIDCYIGGKEHACMHLIYFRFYTKFLRDIGVIDFNEPAVKLFNQGMVHGVDGSVMSKSRGNVIDPLEMISRYGADTLRFYLVCNASADKDFLWGEESIEGSFRFVKKVIDYFEKVKFGKSGPRVESKFNQAIKDITADVESFRYNLAIIKIRTFFDYLGEEENRMVVEGFLKILSIFCPHICEELWHALGNKNFISLQEWPASDESKINPEIEKREQEISKTIEDIRNIVKIMKEKQGKEANTAYLYIIPKEISNYNESILDMKRVLNIEIKAFANNDPSKHDPASKAGKAKPGKPAIYIE